MTKPLFRQLRSKLPHLKIRSQFLLLLFLAALLAFTFYRFLWKNKWEVYNVIVETTDWLPCLDDDFYQDLRRNAASYEIPDSEKDVERAEALQPYFDIADEYTGIYVYGLEDGLYRAGRAPSALMPQSAFRPLFDAWYNLADALGENTVSLPIEFKNGYATIMIYDYHRTLVLIPWMLFSLTLSVTLFLCIVLFFISRRMKAVLTLEKEVLRMSAGDLETPVQISGYDEIGSLSREIDSLRLALAENIRQEQESRRANQDLITAMSHDLRTPLTILNGYLEILQLGRNPAMQKEYLSRCLKKTNDIRELTDRMFEYALVYEHSDAVQMEKIPFEQIHQRIQENADYIRLVGFSVTYLLHGLPADTIPSGAAASAENSRRPSPFGAAASAENSRRPSPFGSAASAENSRRPSPSGAAVSAENSGPPSLPEDAASAENSGHPSPPEDAAAACPPEFCVLGDSTMIERIFSNLFSNIMKYGDKKEAVAITASFENSMLRITLSNRIRQEYTLTESNRIGLKSVQKMVSLMNGEFLVHTDGGAFITEILLFLTNAPPSAPAYIPVPSAP